MSDPQIQQRLVKDLGQPAPPAQPRSERGFIRSHLPHLRLGSNAGKRSRRASLNQEPVELEGFSITQQGSGNLSGTGDDDSQVDSLSAVLLANSQPLSRRSGSLDRHPSLQRSSLRPSVSLSAASRPLLDNANSVAQGAKPSLPIHPYGTCLLQSQGSKRPPRIHKLPA